MNNDGETSISYEDDVYVAKYRQFLPAGQTGQGFRKDPLVQFYGERLQGKPGQKDLFTTLRTIRTDQVTRIKGLSPYQLQSIAAQARAEAAAVDPPPARKRVKRKKLVK
jgi:hypothetical protein